MIIAVGGGGGGGGGGMIFWNYIYNSFHNKKRFSDKIPLFDRKTSI